MQTIGAYAFVTEDYKHKDYPLDLWIQWSVKLFDQVALVTYGTIDLPSYRNLVTEALPPIEKDTFAFYTIGKNRAQHLLQTDWKVLLDIDEFPSTRIDTSSLDKRMIYATRIHHLYGNANTEILDSGLPSFMYRIHYGNKDILGDGYAVRGAQAGRLSIGKSSFRLFEQFVNKMLC